MTHESPNHDPWKHRRRFLIVYTLFVMVLVGKSVFDPVDPSIATTTISSGLTSLGAVVGAYVFGAAWERKELEKPAPVYNTNNYLPPVSPHIPVTEK